MEDTPNYQDEPGYPDEIGAEAEAIGTKNTPLAIYLVAGGAIILMILLALSY